MIFGRTVALGLALSTPAWALTEPAEVYPSRPPPPAPVEPAEPADSIRDTGPPAPETPEKPFQPGALIQGWVVGSSPPAVAVQLRLRRVQLEVRGDGIADRFGYRVVADPASPAAAAAARPLPPLLFAYLTATTSAADLSLGQLNSPVSLEGFGSPGRLLLPERALVSRRFGNTQDLGVRVAKTLPTFGYAFYAFGGERDGAAPRLAKDVALRAHVGPLAGLLLGGSLYRSVGHRHAIGARDRYEFDLRLEQGPFLLQAEAIVGRDSTVNGLVRAAGYYAALAVRPWEPLQLVGRFGELGNGWRVPWRQAGSSRHADVGLNWYIRGDAVKVQLSTSWLDAAGERQLETIASLQIWL
jgi:hypothetical protein